jgi:hypothetical protein
VLERQILVGIRDQVHGVVDVEVRDQAASIISRRWTDYDLDL